jgi:osmotically-inducible protein OsmY
MAALHRNAQVEANNIQISIKHGKVTLHGSAKVWYERGVVERAAWSVPGVTQVETT